MSEEKKSNLFCTHEQFLDAENEFFNNPKVLLPTIECVEKNPGLIQFYNESSEAFKKQNGGDDTLWHAAFYVLCYCLARYTEKGIPRISMGLARRCTNDTNALGGAMFLVSVKEQLLKNRAIVAYFARWSRDFPVSQEGVVVMINAFMHLYCLLLYAADDWTLPITSEERKQFTIRKYRAIYEAKKRKNEHS